MDNRFKYKYAIIRFVPNQLRGEFVNIGIILHILDGVGLLHAKWLPKLGKMRCISSDITDEEFRNFKKYISKNFKATTGNLFSPKTIISEKVTTDSPKLLDYLHSEMGGQFQFSVPSFGYTSNVQQLLEKLYRDFVDPDFEEKEEEVDEEKEERVSLREARQKVANVLRENHLYDPGPFGRDVLVPGSTTLRKFDFAHLNGGATLLQVISLGQLSEESKNDRALVLVGKVTDVRATNIQVESYAITHEVDDPDRMVGNEAVKSYISNHNIQIIAQDDTDYLAKQFKNSFTYSIKLLT
jgi:Fe-S cluster assembly iron-binding protein IscA